MFEALISLVMTIYKNEGWNRWANAYLDGTDRSSASAREVANATWNIVCNLNQVVEMTSALTLAKVVSWEKWAIQANRLHVATEPAAYVADAVAWPDRPEKIVMAIDSIHRYITTLNK